MDDDLCFLTQDSGLVNREERKEGAKAAKAKS
jgi:hypothetical protein